MVNGQKVCDTVNPDDVNARYMQAQHRRDRNNKEAANVGKSQLKVVCVDQSCRIMPTRR